MKYCPTCGERYDEEIIRFCTKDGTPLIEEEQPNFTALPSESSADDEDLGEQTVIRRKPVVAAVTEAGEGRPDSERIVISTAPPRDPVRARTQAYYQQPPPQNTVKTVVLTIVGTLAVLGFGAGLFWLFQGDKASNLNVNVNSNLANQNVNLNTNLGFDANFNFNTNANFNTNYNALANINMNAFANVKTPTPTPSPKPSPSVAPTPSPTATPSASPSPTRPPANTRPSPTPSSTPRIGPRPPTPANRPPGNQN